MKTKLNDTLTDTKDTYSNLHLTWHDLFFDPWGQYKQETPSHL